MTTPIAIEAFVHPSEQPALRFAAVQLATQLGNDQWPVAVRFADRTRAGPMGPATLVVASLLAEALGQAPLDEVERRWRAWLAGLHGQAALFLCTAFRAADAEPAQPAWAERARRVNRLAAELSCDFAAHLVDFDRVFGLLGGRLVRAAGAAEQVAGHVLVRCLLAGGLDGIVPDATLARAEAASPAIVVRPGGGEGGSA